MSDSKKTFTYGDITAVVDHVGSGEAPWDPDGETRHKYKITIKGPGGARYTSEGYGSTNDWNQGTLDHRSLAWATISDLYSARMDPDEFINLVIGEASGRKALERGKVAEKIIKDAKKFPEDALQAAYEKTQEEGA